MTCLELFLVTQLGHEHEQGEPLFLRKYLFGQRADGSVVGLTYP